MEHRELIKGLHDRLQLLNNYTRTINGEPATAGSEMF